MFAFASDAYIPLFSMLIFLLVNKFKEEPAAYFHSPEHAFSIAVNVFRLKVHFAGAMIISEIKKGIRDTDRVPRQWRDLGTNPDLAQKGLYMNS